jgi:hypothetical protein
MFERCGLFRITEILVCTSCYRKSDTKLLCLTQHVAGIIPWNLEDDNRDFQGVENNLQVAWQNSLLLFVFL